MGRSTRFRCREGLRRTLNVNRASTRLVDQLRGADPTTEHFADLVKLLSAEVRDHLDEEEHGTFQLAGKLLTKTQQKQLAVQYRAEYSKRGGPHTV